MGAYISLGVTYCASKAVCSLCNSCFGSTAAGTTGRKRSALLLSATVALALFFQYSLAPAIINKTGWWKAWSSIPGLGKMVYQAWMDDCLGRYGEDAALVKVCVQNSGVYRPTAFAALLYAAMAVATNMRPSLNREAWPAKYGAYFLLVFLSIFMSNGPLFDGIFLFVARFGAMAFILMEQVIIIDIAYNWNESWVEKADESDRLEWGSGKPWLRLIVASCVLLYASALTGIGLLYHYFSDCPENSAVITLTLLGVLALTGVQLTGTEGSLLTSSCVSAYSVYLSYLTVSKNPNSMCNPQLGSNDVQGIVIGLGLTALSLAWIGFSWTAEGRLNRDGLQTTSTVSPSTTAPHSDGIDLNVPFIDPEDAPTTGHVVDTGDDLDTSSRGTELWKLNVVLALISCWIACMLTGWGTIEAVVGEDAEMERMANPTVGRVNMAMIGISQWTAILMYGWTLVAPRLFPDRDFA